MPMNDLTNRLAAGFTAAAAAIPLLALALVAGEEAATASPLASDASFEAAFDPFEREAGKPLLTETERLKAQLVSATAPVEVAEEAAPLPSFGSGETIGEGTASFYGARFAGRKTASGERFNPAQLTAAHRTLPFGSKVKVTNKRNGRSVVVRINDRGPFSKGRVIDLSKAAAQEIGLVNAGHGPVELALLGG